MKYQSRKCIKDLKGSFTQGRYYTFIKFDKDNYLSVNDNGDYHKISKKFLKEYFDKPKENVDLITLKLSI